MQKSRYPSRWLLSIALTLLITCPAFGQLPQGLTPSELANGPVHIVAVMVEFQEDDNRFTSGNGKFNPSFLDSDSITLDPLPHDRGYFEAHLEFAKNYFERVSGGRLQVSYEVLPEIVTLNEEMAAYSPLGEDGAENEKLAFFARDVWEEVGNRGLLSGANHDPERTMYIAFHAGVGRDLELTGTTLFKTPQDIPSVYLSQGSFRRLFNNPSFDGFNVNGVEIRNTAILPETQSRAGENVVGEEFVLELSINGITSATIGSFLGLPDLFNTETGRSGIGRFGLMDGAGFFSYFGLFPPELSAWEKYYLGWVDPVDISDVVDNSGTVSLTAPTAMAPGTVAKLPISTDEYFLIENRIRDPLGDGVTFTIRRPDGSIESVTIARDEERLDPFDFSEIDEVLPSGVVIDVSHFDWSLPGGLDAGEDRTVGTDDDRFLNGGILIWHIDDQIIRSRIDDNAINNDPMRRGVRLVEADAAQDIGRPAGGVTQYDQGAPFDFWWAGNDFTVITLNGQRIVLYENRFADDTRPNNRSNSGARTYFEFYDFSDNLVEATFQTRRVLDVPGFQPVTLPVSHAGQELWQTTESSSSYTLSLTQFTSGADTVIVIPNDLGIGYINPQTGTFENISFSKPLQPLMGVNGFTVGGNTFAGGTSTAELRGYSWNSVTGRFDNTWTNDDFEPVGLLGRYLSASNEIELTRTPFRINESDGSLAADRGISYQTTSNDIGSLRDDATVFNTTEPVFNLNSSESSAARLYLASASPGIHNNPVFILWSTERVVVFEAENGNILSEFDATDISWPILADFSGDGRADIIYTNLAENTIEARNLQGAFLDRFPIAATENIQFTGTPLVIEASNDLDALLITPITDSYSVSLQVRGKSNLRQPIENLLVGSDRADVSPIQPVVVDGIIYAVSPSGDMRAWKMIDRSDAPSAYIFGDPRQNIVGRDLGEHTSTNENELLIARETYNWPNPANESTNIRFMTTSESDVTITVIGYNGQKLYESRHSTRGSIPQEVQLNTSAWSNGVYFARVTARSNGKTEHKVITMVVIR